MTKFHKILRKKTENQLINDFITLFKQILDKKKKINFVVVGGSSPIKLYKSLSKIKVNWNMVNFFWGDERYVSSNSKNSNFRLLKTHLLKKIKVRKINIFNIKTNKRTLEQSANLYEKTIKKVFKNKKICFDLALLGMGHDGHIASIFEEYESINDKSVVFWVHKKNFDRISLSLKTINNSKRIFLWLNNKKKSSIFKKYKNSKLRPVNWLKKNKTTLFIRDS